MFTNAYMDLGKTECAALARDHTLMLMNETYQKPLIPSIMELFWIN